MRDQLECMEDAAEDRYDEMTEGVPKGHYRCACGRITPDCEQNFLSPNPYTMPSCGTCFEEFMAQPLEPSRPRIKWCSDYSPA